MSQTQKSEPTTVVVDDVPITPQLLDVLKNLIDQDPALSKDILATGNMFIHCIHSEDLEQMDKMYFSLQLDFFKLLGALENRKDAYENI